MGWGGAKGESGSPTSADAATPTFTGTASTAVAGSVSSHTHTLS